MNWGSLAEFIAMGGYGGYVWGSFGVTIACMALEVVALSARRRAALRALPDSTLRKA
jgi:heme exporter protein D